MHVAEIGEGPAVLFVHGFPELWYTWRHQMLSLSSQGYRTIAPDLRGYGESDAPPSPTSYTALHIVGDLVGLLDALGLDQVFLVGHDWGATICWYFCLFRPDRIKALVNMSVAFRPRHPSIKPVEAMRAMMGDGYYVCRFQVNLISPVFDCIWHVRFPTRPCRPKWINSVDYVFLFRIVVHQLSLTLLFLHTVSLST